MSQNLNSLFKVPEAASSDTQETKGHNDKVKAQKWFSNQRGLFDNIKRNLKNKPEGVSDSDVYKALGIKHGGTYTFKLKNGDDIACDLLSFKGREEIEAKTEVHESNGRDQDSLTKESLTDILDSIGEAGENLFAGVGGYTELSGKITVFDGSRRRMSCIYTDSTFRMYVARDMISLADAKYIADISRLTKKLSYREEGTELLKIFDSNESLLNMDQLAEYVGQSKAGVAKKVSAANIPQALIEVFPDYNGISGEVYGKISSIMNSIKKKSVDECKKDYCPPSDAEGHVAYAKLLESAIELNNEIYTGYFVKKSKGLDVSGLSIKEQHIELVKLLKAACLGVVTQKSAPISIVEVSDNKYITKTTTGKGDRQKVKFTVSHLPEHKLLELEKFMGTLFSD